MQNSLLSLFLAALLALSPFHPETVAISRAHERRVKGLCGVDAKATKKERRALKCTCVPDPADLADLWAGRVRMARARPLHLLDDIDREALARAATVQSTERAA